MSVLEQLQDLQDRYPVGMKFVHEGQECVISGHTALVDGVRQIIAYTGGREIKVPPSALADHEADI